MTPSEAPDSYKIAKIWTFFCIFILLFIIAIQNSSYFEMDAFGIWILSCLAIIYLSKKNTGQYSEKQQKIIIIIGFLMCVLSFFSIPIGITNPPYSIGELSLLLSGIGVIVFGLFNSRSLVLPVSIPFIAVMGFGLYELFLRHQDWITAPAIPFIVTLTISLLNLFGISAVSDGNVISFMSQTGSMVYLAIVSDCTGIWSLGTFTIATIIVLSSFPQSISRKSIGLIGIGYFGTFCANIIRILVISLSGYFFGPRGIIEQVHVHIGWIVFSAWMVIFWYYYFTRQIGISFIKKRG
jgi:exosortase/archaeosortase family protein